MTNGRATSMERQEGRHQAGHPVTHDHEAVPNAEGSADDLEQASSGKQQGKTDIEKFLSMSALRGASGNLHRNVDAGL